MPKPLSGTARRELPLSPRFLEELSRVLNTAPGVGNAVFGVKEALGLEGLYGIKVTAAKLVPVESPQPPENAS